MSRSNVIKQEHGGISGRRMQKRPNGQEPAQASGSGEGSVSAMAAMVKKRREGENHTEESLPVPREEARVAGQRQQSASVPRRAGKRLY